MKNKNDFKPAGIIVYPEEFELSGNLKAIGNDLENLND